MTEVTVPAQGEIEAFIKVERQNGTEEYFVVRGEETIKISLQEYNEGVNNDGYRPNLD